MSGRGGAAVLALVMLVASCARAGVAAEPLPSSPPTAGASTTTVPPATTSTASTTSSSTTSTTAVWVPPPTAAPPRVKSAPVTTEPAPAPPETAPPETAPPDTAPPETAPPMPTAPTVFAVGDSVMLRAADGLRGLSGFDVTVDAEVGRQFSAGIPLVRAAVARGTSIIVIHLGTNGPVSASQFEQMMAAAAGAKVLVVTVQLPDETYPHEAPTNATLVEGAARHGASVVDWNGATNGHPELLRPDGYHMDPAAVPLYVSLVAAAL